MNAQLLYFAGLAFPVENLGPGRRVVIWLEGCSLNCSGCMSPDLFARKHPVGVGEVARQTLAHLEVADGLTISGGEPFQQPAAVTSLVRHLRELLPVEVLVYSGLTKEEILAGSAAQRDLLRLVDILIDGRFESTVSNTKHWRGSDNQRVHLLSDRARKYAGLTDRPFPPKRVLHVQPLEGMRVRLIGIPERDHWMRLREAPRVRASALRQECE